MINLIGIFFTILLSAWFAGVEIVFLSFNKVYLPAWVNQKKKGAYSVEFLIKHPERYLVTTLTGNNIVNVAYSSLVTLFIVQFGLSKLFIVIVAPLILLIFGEVLPKSIARQSADRIVLKAGIMLYIFRLALFPVIRIIEIAVSSFCNYLNISIDEMGIVLKKSQLSAVVKEAVEKGEIPSRSNVLIQGILRIGEQKVSDIMTPRTEITGVNLKSSIVKNMEIILKSGYSRFPCYNGDLDSVFGVVSTKSFLKPISSLAFVIYPIAMVPSNLHLLKLLGWFRKNKTNFAGVVDEYGGFAGIVTLEDLIEEMVGPIQDEFDLDNLELKRISKNVWIVHARMRLSHLASVTGFSPKSNGMNTVGGLVNMIESGIPTVGKVINLPEGVITILRANPKGVEFVRLTVRDVD